MPLTDPDVKTWIRSQLARKGRGSQARLAKHLGLTDTKVSRMLSEAGEARQITAAELINALSFFDNWDGLLDDAVPARTRAVPVLSPVSAGRLRETVAASDVSTAESVDVSGLGNGEFFALRVDGDSMNKISPEGSIIIVDASDRELVSGGFYVFSLRGEATFKRWEDDPPRLEPFSRNDVHRTIYPRDDGDWFVVGRVRRTMLDL